MKLASLKTSRPVQKTHLLGAEDYIWHSWEDSTPLLSMLMTLKNVGGLWVATCLWWSWKTNLVTSRLQGVIEEEGDGKYSVTYAVPEDAETGSHMLNVCLHGAHINGSPFTVNVSTGTFMERFGRLLTSTS